MLGSVLSVPTCALLTKVVLVVAETVAVTAMLADALAAKAPAVLLQVSTLLSAPEPIAQLKIPCVAATVTLLSPAGNTSTTRTVLARASAPVLATVSVKATAAPGALDCGSAWVLVSRSVGGVCAVFRSIAQPAGMLLLVQALTWSAVGAAVASVASPPPPTRALFMYWVPLVIAPALASRLNWLTPPAAIGAADVQLTSVALRRVQVQSAALAPVLVNVAGQFIGPGSTSRKLMVPTEAVSPVLLTRNAYVVVPPT